MLSQIYVTIFHKYNELIYFGPNQNGTEISDKIINYKIFTCILLYGGVVHNK